MSQKTSFVPSQTTTATKAGTDSPRVLKLTENERPTITSFEMQSVRKPSLATPPKTAPAKPMQAQHSQKMVPQKDRRFSLSALVQDPARLEAEARLAFDTEVSTRLHSELERTKQGAFDQGFAEGAKAGEEKAHAEASAAAQVELEKIQALVRAFEGARTEIYQANERYLTELVFRIGRMLFLKDLSADKDYLSRLARELVDRVGTRENIRIKLNPKDADRIAQIKADLTKDLGELRNLSIETDSGIAGGLEVQTEWSALDASIDTQLKAVHEAITGSST